MNLTNIAPLTRWLGLLPVLITLAAMGCGAPPPNTALVSPANKATPVVATPAIASPSPAATVGPIDQDLSSKARFLIGKDDGKKEQPDVGNPRISVVADLLSELARLSGEKVSAIADATNSTADLIQSKYGKHVTRQKLLEDMKIVYSDPRMKAIKLDYKTALFTKAMVEYAK